MIKVGVVGCGDIANRSYLPALAGELRDTARLTAVCDIIESRARAAREKFDARKSYRWFREMLKDGDFDLLVVLTPLLTHQDFAGPAIAAGKHVFTEKPLARTAREALKLVHAARKRHVQLAAAPYPPATPLLRKARQLVASGAIGKVTLARAHSSHGGAEQGWWSNDPSWTFRRKLSGPVPPLFDMGIYGLSALAAVIGPVKRVAAFSGLGVPYRRIAMVREKGFKPYTLKVDSHDNSYSLLDFGDGKLAALDASYCLRVGDAPPYQFYGTEGAMTIDVYGSLLRVHSRQGKAGLPKGKWKDIKVPPRGSSTFLQGLRHALDCLRMGRKPVNGGEFSAHLVEVLEGAIRSARTGRAVPLKTSFRWPE